jgi:hypothetical protein
MFLDLPVLPIIQNSYTYTGDNVSKVTRHYGTMTGNVFGALLRNTAMSIMLMMIRSAIYTITNVYKISRLLSTNNDKVLFYLRTILRDGRNRSYPNIPTPIVKSTNYVYDPQTYMTKDMV